MEGLKIKLSLYDFKTSGLRLTIELLTSFCSFIIYFERTIKDKDIFFILTLKSKINYF